MSFDAWIVSFGISTLLRQLRLIPGSSAYAFMAAVILLDGWMLVRFFARQPRR